MEEDWRYKKESKRNCLEQVETNVDAEAERIVLIVKRRRGEDVARKEREYENVNEGRQVR